MPGKKSKEGWTGEYKTEEQIKNEIKENMERRRFEEMIRKPKSKFEAAVENYWYHYKAITLGSLAVIAIVIFFLWDMVFTPKPDITVVMATSSYYPQELQDNLRRELEKYCPDINGDGRVILQIDHIPFAPDPISREELEAASLEAQSAPPDEDAEMSMQGMSQEDYAYIMKLMAIVAAGQEQVYILDGANYNYLTAFGEDDLFLDLEAVPGGEGKTLPLGNTKLSDAPDMRYYDNLSFYLRNFIPTEKNKQELEGNERFIANLAQ